jgi:hypothetical protein
MFLCQPEIPVSDFAFAITFHADATRLRHAAFARGYGVVEIEFPILDFCFGINFVTHATIFLSRP